MVALESLPLRHNKTKGLGVYRRPSIYEPKAQDSLQSDGGTGGNGATIP